MGYEIRLFAVERVSEDGYASVVADIDLCKIGQGNLADLLHQSTPKKPKAYVFGLDGNRRFKKDRYDAPLSIMEVDDVIKAIEADNQREPYRRFELALATLKAFKIGFGEDAKILGYGH